MNYLNAMDNENIYTNTLKKLSDEELADYVDQPENYEQDAVIAAIIELRKREKANEKALALLKIIEEERKYMPLQQAEVIPEQNIQIAIPILYSKGAIRFFTIFFSTLFGGILLAINLNRIQKNAEILYVLAFSFIYTYLIGIIVTYFPQYISLIALFMNLLGLVILEKIFWKRMIGDDRKFQRQSIWFTFGVGILIAILLLIFIMK